MAGVIPKRLHFIFGLTPDFGGKPFSFVHWAAIRSAQLANPDWDTVVWCAHEPENRYFDAIRPHVHTIWTAPPVRVFGNPIDHPAHMCDWLRLQFLKQFGGVYLDLDTITVKPFNAILTPPVTMIAETVNGDTVGLCNAFIAAEPNAEFINAWIEKFRKFRSTGHDQYWNESAVKWPHELYRNGGECTAFPATTFMKPDWTPQGIAAMFTEKHEFPHAYGHHLWESFSWPHLSQYTPENYRSFDCTYSQLLERTLAEEIRKTF